MSGYRPVTDCMIMGRPKYKYHGHFPAGFLERARYLLGCTCPDEGIWHVCSGAVKFYNKSDGFIKLSGYNKKYDVCLDIDANTKPDIIYDVREMDKIKRNGNNRLRIPQRAIKWEHKGNWQNGFHASESFDRPKAMLIDRPYDEENAAKYKCGPDVLPDLNKLTRDCLELVKPGGLVGTLDYKWPSPGQDYKELFAGSVGTGRKNNARWFIVWQKRK